MRFGRGYVLVGDGKRLKKMFIIIKVILFVFEGWGGLGEYIKFLFK